MADETTMQQRSQRTKLTLSDLGDPARVKSMTPEELGKTNGKYVLGYLTGKASGFVERSDLKTAEKFEGLSGIFVMVPEDPKREELESGVLFIPDAFHNLIAAQLRDQMNVDDGKGATVEFIFEVSSFPAKNPAGYSWDFKPAIPFKGKHLLDDTLNAVRQLKAAKMKALAPPTPQHTGKETAKAK